jgi:ATP synthase protein I
MTTESHHLDPHPGPRRRGSTSLLAGAALGTLVLGGVAALLGGLLDGRDAAYAAIVGTAVVVAVFGLGSLVVDRVAGALPSAALLVALMTYTLQVVLLAALFLALSGSGLLDHGLDRRWLAGTIIGGTFVWLLAHLVLAVRVRIPVYELPDPENQVSNR